MKSWRERQGIRTILGLYTNQKARRDSAPMNERPIGTFSVLCFAFVSANDWERDTSHGYECNSAWGTYEILMYFYGQFFFFQRFNETSWFKRGMGIGSKHPVFIKNGYKHTAQLLSGSRSLILIRPNETFYFCGTDSWYYIIGNLLAVAAVTAFSDSTRASSIYITSSGVHVFDMAVVRAAAYVAELGPSCLPVSCSKLYARVPWSRKYMALQS